MADNQFINFNSQDVADMYRRNQYARMLQEQANAPIERPSYKGIEAPLHATQGAAKLAAGLLAGWQQNEMNDSYAAEKSAAEQKVIAERDRQRAEVADYQKGFDPVLIQGASGGVADYGTPETGATPRSQGEIYAHALRGAGSDNPQVANIGRMRFEQQRDMEQDRASQAAAVEKEKVRVSERKEDRGDRANELKVRMAVDGDRSKAPPGYRFSPNGDLSAIPGGPADLKINAESFKKRTDATDVLSILDEVDTLLPNSTGSMIGSLVDSAAGAVGSTTKGAEAAQQLRVLQGGLIAKMPKMSGPQSDKDVLLYKQMAGELGDDTIPIQRRQAAASIIRKLNSRYADGNTEQASSKSNTTVSNW